MTWLSSSNDRTPSKAETTKMARALPTIYENGSDGGRDAGACNGAGGRGEGPRARPVTR